MATIRLGFHETKQALQTLLNAGTWRDAAPTVVIEEAQELEELIKLRRFINITQDGFVSAEGEQPIGAGLYDRVDITYALECAQYATQRQEAVRLRDRMVEDAVAIITADRQLGNTVAFFNLISGDEITVQTDANSFFSAYSVLIEARRNIQAS